MSSADSVPVGSILANKGLNNLGQFTGIAVGDGIQAAAQGSNVALDVLPGGATSAAALLQGAWNVNAITGDDRAAGGPGAPIKTLAELSRRLGIGNLLPGVLNTSISPIQQISVTLETDIPISDPLRLDVCLPANTLLAFAGTVTTIRSDTLAVVTAKAPLTNQPWEVTATATPFVAGDVGSRIRITSGANAGMFAWIVKVTAGVARCTSFAIFTAGQNIATASPTTLIQSGVTSGVVAPLDPFVLERPSTLTICKCNVSAVIAGASITTICGFINIDFVGGGGFPNQNTNVTGTCTQVFKACRTNNTVLVEIQTQSRPLYLNCWCTGSTPAVVGISTSRTGPIFRAGGTGGSVACRNGLPIFDDDFLVQGTGAANGFGNLSDVIVGAACVFDATNGYSAGATSATRIGGGFSGLARLWGAGNSGFGYQASSGTLMRIPSAAGAANITIAGASGDFQLSAGTTSSAWDQAANAGAGAYLVPVANTWANLAAALPGGFNGNAHNVERAAHIVVG